MVLVKLSLLAVAPLGVAELLRLGVTDIELQTACGRRVRMTSDHLVAAMDCQAAAAAVAPLTAGHVGKHLVMAGSLGQQQQDGGGEMTNGSSSMCVVSAGPGGELSADEVVGTRLVPGKGIYTAVTSNPFLVSATSSKPCCSRHSDGLMICD